MVIKETITSMSGIEFFIVVGIIFPVIFIVCIFSFKGESKGTVDACRVIKHDSWAGDLISKKWNHGNKPI